MSFNINEEQTLACLDGEMIFSNKNVETTHAYFLESTALGQNSPYTNMTNFTHVSKHHVTHKYLHVLLHLK